MRDYKSYSFWLEDLEEPLTPRPALAASTEVDVAILGAGYSGLWTAYYLLRQEPGLRVAVLEKEIAGFGASGRNGGWCSSKFPVTAGMLEKRFGSSAARSLLLAMREAVDEVGNVCAEETIDAHFHRGGILTLARGKHQLPGLHASYATYERLGLADRYQMLNASEAVARVGASQVHGGLFTPDGASLHPARLVRGLARAVEARGGVIYEQTPVTDFKPGSLIAPGGEVRAKRATVLAGEVYLTRFPQLHRALLPAYSLISLTEPLTAEQWSQIGWQGGESVSSTRNTVVYLTRTRDGRILFGSRGAPYEFGSRISDEQDTHDATIKMIHGSFAEWFPMLSRCSLYACLGRTGWHAARLDACGALRCGHANRIDHGLHGTGCFYQQPGRAFAGWAHHWKGNWPGEPSARAETVAELGDRTTSLAGGALHAERFSAH